MTVPVRSGTDVRRWSFGGLHFLTRADELQTWQLRLRDAWRARETARLAGNVDWTGADGIRISWGGAASRYYNDGINDATTPGAVIYRNGRQIATAPGVVYGAAQRGPWLLAVCSVASPVLPPGTPYPWAVYHRLLSGSDEDWETALTFNAGNLTSRGRVPWHFNADAATAVWIDWRDGIGEGNGDIWTLTVTGGEDADTPPAASVDSEIGAQETETVTPATNDPPVNFLPAGDNALLRFAALTSGSGATYTGGFDETASYNSEDGAGWNRELIYDYAGTATVTLTFGTLEIEATATYSLTMRTANSFGTPDNPLADKHDIDQSLIVTAQFPWDAAPGEIYNASRSMTINSGSLNGGDIVYSYTRTITAVIPQWFALSDSEDDWSRLVTTITETFDDTIPRSDFDIGVGGGELSSAAAAALQIDVERTDHLVLPADGIDQSPVVNYTRTGVETSFVQELDWIAAEDSEVNGVSGSTFPGNVPAARGIAYNESRFVAGLISPAGDPQQIIIGGYDAIHGTPKEIEFQWTNAAEPTGAGERQTDQLFATEPGLSGVYRITERGATDDDIGIDERRTYELVDAGGVYVRRTRVQDFLDESRLRRADHAALINDVQIWTDYQHSGDAGYVRTIVDNVASTGTITGISNTTDNTGAEAGIKTTREVWRYLFADLRYDLVVQSVYEPVGDTEQNIVTFAAVDADTIDMAGDDNSDPVHHVRPGITGSAAARPIGDDVWLCAAWNLAPSDNLAALWSADESVPLSSLVDAETYYPVGVI